MEHGASVTSLVIVLVVAFLTPIVLHRLKLNIIPVVVAEIIVGLIIGKSGFDIVHQDIWLETLSMLGFIFLMFLSGLEIDFSAFARGKKKEKLPNGNDAPNTFVVSTIVFIGIFGLSLLLSYIFVWLGFTDNVFLMTLIISTISLGVVVPTLKDAQIMKKNIGQIILLVAVIADLVTMVLLAVFASIYGTGDSNMWLLLILFGAGVLLYFLGKYFRNQSFLETMSKGTIQIGTRAIFTLIIVLVALSESIGAENILGAFLAGVLVSLLSPNSDMVHKLDSFGYGFLIPIFFVMVGVQLDVWSLFEDPKILLLIPLLFIALVISKMLPILYLKKYYDWKTTIAAGALLTSTLSLVIAAATIGERMGIIDARMSGALILVAVITSIVTPIWFKKLFPKQESKGPKIKVAFIGANQMTLPVTRELNSHLYETTMYHVKQEKNGEKFSDSLFNIVEVSDYRIETLKELNVFDVDVLVVAIGDDQKNGEIAIFAKEFGIERVIARIETPDLNKSLKEQNIEVFSMLMSTTTLLRALIEAPSVMNILTNQETTLYQINMNNPKYDGIALRNFPFTGDVIFVRIFRGKDSIVPHGDTELKMGDRLILTGSREYVDELKVEMEFSRGLL
ncbi:monovalent cation:proton antiporter family protein [Bacillus luteolus]|uniref:Monovalent cation:proton antiporter family protein n=1 Tax=Litchfieldia luteola TaxID=682179 RepID=A0ABR9QML1_9BACI|nr:monovalent cation:proton antiporter family protein [Cytobacillus luteolus]MBE4909404.1 monovalent cation:proton antiporter family protein [Cytobacillus luteolus]MBP1940803.1 CPA2 family monovalent cation:H+ antiporter-2 [Cytobacillus luteolus]